MIEHDPPSQRLAAWVFAIAALQLAVLLATSTRYGYHRDELYFIVAGSHPAFGYPDQPPLVPLLSSAMHSLAPGSLLALRAPSAVASAATTILAALIAREVGGRPRAQVIAAACAAASAFALAVGHIVSTTTFDMLSTTALAWLLVRAVVRQRGWYVLAAGVVVGVGLEAKPQVGLVAVVMAAALVATGPRALILSRWGAGAAIVAAALAAPYVLWQAQYGWPQLTVAHHIGGSAEGGRAGFLPFQLVLVSPVLVPVWVAGLRAPFRRPGWAALRFAPISYGTLAVLYLAGNGKAYYLASLYPLLLGLGALPTAEWLDRSPGRIRLLVPAIAVSAAVSAFIALPLLPQRDLQGSPVMALNPDQGETVGWPRFIDTVANAWYRLPSDERAHSVIFTSNYGEAGAIDLLGGPRHLPRAYSGHNGFSEWGQPRANATHALLIGFQGARDAAPYFDGCTMLATIDNGVGLNNDEQGNEVMLCAITRPWRALWPRLTHFD